jgi:hypothetical protein
MVNQRLRRASLPIAVSAVVAAVAVTAMVLSNGTAGARTVVAAAAPDNGLARAVLIAPSLAQKDTPAKKKARALAAAAPTDELKFGDLTGEGNADLAAVDSNGVLWVYPGRKYVWDGTGTRSTALFGTRIQVGRGWNAFTSIVRHGDFDADGKQDVLTRDSAGKLTLYGGTGQTSGLFRPGTPAGTGWGIFASIAGAGDVNFDGKDDLLGQKSNGELVLYLGSGNPSTPFTGRGTVIGTGWKGDLLTTVGDWTYDLRPEYLFRNTANYVTHYESKSGAFPIGKGSVVAQPASGVLLKNMVGMGDLTSDSDFEPLPDVVWQDTNGFLYLYAADWKTALDTNPNPNKTVIGSGWAGYRLF